MGVTQAERLHGMELEDERVVCKSRGKSQANKSKILSQVQLATYQREYGVLKLDDGQVLAEDSS